MVTESTDLKAETKSMKLVYSDDKSPGYTKIKNNQNFIYYDTEGKEISNENELARIKSLVIPPAWTNVWICPKPNGHLQATGYDKANRKQYKYHPQWTIHRNEKKHNRMAEFAKSLPMLRKKIENDLQKKEFTKEKVVALAVSIIDKTFIRVGNSAYTKLYGSFGLTTLRNKHIKISGKKMTIFFKGKKGVFQEITLTHSRLTDIMKKLKDIPGQELFQFYDADGSKKSINSECINEYIRNNTGKDFTAKDFRTWWGTVTAAIQLAELPSSDDAEILHKNLLKVLDFVAKKLGNTRAVCKKYYVHPVLQSYYEEGKMDKYLTTLRRIKPKDKIEDMFHAEEEFMLDFIEKECI